MRLAAAPLEASEPPTEAAPLAVVEPPSQPPPARPWWMFWRRDG